MIETGRLVHGPYDVGHASRPKFGETACGDAVWVASAGDEIHVAVIDGLGHGPAAAEAASTGAPATVSVKASTSTAMRSAPTAATVAAVLC